MTDDQARAISRGEHAQRLLSDPLMQEALQHLKSSVRDAFFDLPIEASEQREKLALLDHMRQQFERVFFALVDGATVARQELLLEENMAVKTAKIMERVRNG